MIKEFVILGGGSAYTPGLLQALIAHGSRLGLTRVRLYDTHTEHLELVGRLGSAMARSAGASFTVETAPNLVAALTGADVVLNSTRPGGFAARRIDETLPLSLGIPGQETVGPGGFFFALRSVPEALNLADTMALHAPDALLLNYTNPSNIVTQALVDHGRVRVLGLCDQSDEDLQALAQALGRPQAAYTFRCNGLNHATWYSDIQLDGVALTDLPEHLPIPQDMNEEHQLRFALSLEMARKTPGYWPNSYLPYYQAPEQFVALARTQGPRSDAIVARLPSYYAHFREEADKEHPQHGGLWRPGCHRYYRPTGQKRSDAGAQCREPGHYPTVSAQHRHGSTRSAQCQRLDPGRRARSSGRTTAPATPTGKLPAPGSRSRPHWGRGHHFASVDSQPPGR
jgi:6-phospho-beta-glucosidase